MHVFIVYDDDIEVRDNICNKATIVYTFDYLGADASTKFISFLDY
jgi:hypothetical protein